MDSFIDLSLELLEAYPAATVSITYSNEAKKDSKVGKDSSRRPANKVKFKVSDLGLSKSVKYSTTKAKEVSKILTFLGPNGVSTKRKASEEGDGAKKQKLSVGVASVMSNSKIESVPVVQSVDPVVADGNVKEEETGSKKKKKKGKKK